MLKKLYIALAIIFVVSSIVYFIYSNPEIPGIPELPSLSTIIGESTPSPTPTAKPTFDTSPLSGSGSNNSLLESETKPVAPPAEPFCTEEPCASTVTQIEAAFKNCQVKMVTSIHEKGTSIQLINDQFIQVPRSPEGAELEIQSMINANEEKCDPDPVWVLE